MRLAIRVTTAGEEVGRLVVDERDLTNALSQMGYAALGQYRDERNVLGAFEDLTITVTPHAAHTH